MRIQNSGNGEARVSARNPSESSDLGAFDGNVKREFVEHNVNGTMETTVPEAYVHCVPTMTGGFGGRGVRRFYSEHFVNLIPQRHENHTHLPYRRQRSVIEMKARTVFQRLEVVMRSVAPAPCIALEPDRRSADIQSFESELRRRIVGQDHAIDSLVSAFQGVRAGLVPARRPIRNFLFLGPTGSGKTRSVEAVAEILFGRPEAIIKIDCGEFQHSHEISKLIGSPPGYIGHRETPAMLSQAHLDECHTAGLKLTLVLFDEIEKANEALWQLLLGILDKGILTLGDNQQVDFSKTMVFMTSNLGASEMQHAAEGPIGFLNNIGSSQENLTTIAINAARKRFSPEFLNRLDEILVFHPLRASQLRQVVAVEIERLESRLKQATGSEINLRLSHQAVDFLLERGTDGRYGARHLKRVLEKYLVVPFSSFIDTQQMGSAGRLNVGLDRSTQKLTFCKQAMS